MIDHIDPVNRLIYLDDSTVDSTIQPIDIYREMRELRANDVGLRKFDLFLVMRGGEKKDPDGLKRTERYLVLLNNTYIVPYDTSHILTIDGTIISDSGLEGIRCFNRANLTDGVEVDINYAPKQVEVITVQIPNQDLTTVNSKLDTLATDVRAIKVVQGENMAETETLIISSTGVKLIL